MLSFSLLSPKILPNGHGIFHHHHHGYSKCNTNAITSCFFPHQYHQASLAPAPKSNAHPSRRSLLLLSISTALSLPPPPSFATPDTPPPPPDSTITDRVFLDLSICPSYFRSQTQDAPLCPDSEPMGRVVLGLYGKLVPITVTNFNAMCTGSAGSSYKNTLIHKVLPGQFFMAGLQGRKEKGEVSPPLELSRNTEAVESRAFLLEHSRPGVVTLPFRE